MRELFILAAVSAVAAAQTPDVSLTLGVERSTFRVGERIPVTLQFANRGTPDVYFEKRVGMWSPEVFAVSPRAAAVNPLADAWGWRDTGFVSSTGSGLLKPGNSWVLPRDLNDYVVFRSPGTYRIRVLSTRVFDQAPIQSNEVTISVAPRDAAEDARQFQAARGDLKPDPLAAIRTLRFLETEEAAHLLASLFGHGMSEEEEIHTALWSSPFREVIMDDLDRHLRDPDLGVTTFYAATLTQMRCRQTEHRLGRELSNAEMDAISQDVEKEALEAAPQKLPEARAITWHFLSLPPSHYGSEARLKMNQSFFDLPRELMGPILVDQWNLFAGPEMVPVLKEALAGPFLVRYPELKSLLAGRLRELTEIEPGPR
jgi:hypothetical protein